jgi:hypothetical protein
LSSHPSYAAPSFATQIEMSTGRLFESVSKPQLPDWHSAADAHMQAWPVAVP